jgi:hypothetical protein
MNNKIDSINQMEMIKLAMGLEARGIEFEIRTTPGMTDGALQIVVPSIENPEWDAVCSNFTYGGANGLIEISGKYVDEDYIDDVQGWLSAEDILERIDRAEMEDQMAWEEENMEVGYDPYMGCYTDDC